MIQPGPLTRPPNERSLVTPSFRIIDFGRSERYETYLDNASGETMEDVERAAKQNFARECVMENRDVKNELEMPL